MKYLFWRGDSLWCRYPLPQKPAMYPLGIYRVSKSKAETQRCERLGELKLSEFRVNSVTGELQAKRVIEYNPKFWRLVGRYWYYCLRFKKSGSNERYHLAHCLKRFGSREAKSITREDVELWRQEMVKSGSQVNAVNNRYAYLKRVFTWSNSESVPGKRIMYDPCIGLKKLPGAKVRTFVLTREKFERNYILLRDGRKWPGEKPDKHCSSWQIPPDPKFALFYLGLWETMRRPEEVSQYTWEMITQYNIDGHMVNCFQVPPELSKTDSYDVVLISDRLFAEISATIPHKGLVFTNADGNRWKEWSRHKAKLVRVYGEDAGWIRDCRRGSITNKIEAEGFDPVHVKMQSGHKTDAMFQRYRIGKLKNVCKMYENTEENTGKKGINGTK